MQKRNIPTDRAQRTNEKKWGHVIMFTLAVMVIKMSKMAQFWYFLLMATKNLVTVRANYLSASERSYRVLSKNDIVNRLRSFYARDI